MKNRISILFLLAGTAFLHSACEEKGEFETVWQESGPPRITIENPHEVLEPELFGNDKKKMYRPIVVEHAGSRAGSSYVKEKTAILENMIGFEADTSFFHYKAKINRYGGYVHLPRHEATGRFHTRKVNGRWWIIDPEGCPWYWRGVSSVADNMLTTFPEGFRHKYGGSKNNWMRMTAREMRKDVGVNGYGGFLSNQTFMDYNQSNDYLPMPYAPTFAFLNAAKTKGGWTSDEEMAVVNELACVFYPNFYENMVSAIAEQLGSYVGDKNLIGIFSDNEKCFSANAVRLLRDYMLLSPEHPGRKAAEAFMVSKGGVPTVAGYEAHPAREILNDEFSGIVADKYYKACRDGIKAMDPKMMYLGSRLHGTPKTLEFVIKAAAKHCDIISINYYGHWSPHFIPNYEKWVDAPFVVTEYWAQGIDYGHAADTGTGFKVKTEFDKATFFHNFALGLLESKLFIGWCWFRYQDAPEVNNGVVGKDFQIYPVFGQYMRDLNYNVDGLIGYFDSE